LLLLVSGRAGIKGTAYTLVTEKDKEFVGHIVRNLEAANQEVTKDLMDLVKLVSQRSTIEVKLWLFS
jgi:superfamily II DNA/RNA helicase